jgi:hypothetical protein
MVRKDTYSEHGSLETTVADIVQVLNFNPFRALAGQLSGVKPTNKDIDWLYISEAASNSHFERHTRMASDMF